jgi:hypothetical protein
MNRKENWLRAIRNDRPSWLPDPWEPFWGAGGPLPFFFLDPLSRSFRPFPTPKDRPFRDAWGVTWLLQEGSPGAVPIVTDENKVIRDIVRWEDDVRFPPLDDIDWTEADATLAGIDRSETLVMPMVSGGIFELSHNLCGFEDCLTAMLLEPEAMDRLYAALADWKINVLERIMDHLRPEVVHYHDDWGGKDRLFMAPEVWRTLIRPHHQRIVDAVKRRGALFMHHADCVCAPIAADMADMGIDIWQGVIPQNDIPAVQRRIGTRMALMGGIDAQVIDRADADEETIRAEVRRCIDAYVPNGAFLPCIPNIAAIHPHVERIYRDEIRVYGAKKQEGRA